MIFLIFILFMVFVTISQENPTDDNSQKYNEQTAREFIILLNDEMSAALSKAKSANWDYVTNITTETQLKRDKAVAEYYEFRKNKSLEVAKYPWRTFNDASLKIQFMTYSGGGSVQEKSKKSTRNNMDMQRYYLTTKICDYNNLSKCDLAMNPDITTIFAKSQNPEELKHIWLEWHNKAARPVKNLYVEFVDLKNEIARLNNFTDYSEQLISLYGVDNFTEEIDKLWLQLKPFFNQIHAYVRHKLRQQYGNNIVSEKGPIPMHLLGNIMAEQWDMIASKTQPYPNKEKIDVTSEMISQNYTVLKMFKLAEEFFTSIGLDAMPQSFWEKSVFEKPIDREIACQAQAWDFYNSKDFRIKMCAVVSQKDLFNIHHEMGHIEYFMQYKDQPLPFRDGANPGFQEAIGDVMSLSVSTPKHLRQVGLLKSNVDNMETSINHLYRMAMEKIVFLPFGYVVDLWRWNVFKGDIIPDNYTSAWWNLRKQYQGIVPPVNRTEEDFDPAAKYHVVADVPYISYFISFIIQFQFHKALCEKANQYRPDDPNKLLHMCDIYNSTEAGKSLQNMLKMGSSRSWPDAMEVIAGTRNMDAGPITEYFKPLHDWLKKYNEENNVFVGWD